MRWTTVAGSLATCVIAVAAVPAPAAHATNGDTRVTGEGLAQTLDCNDATLIVNGTANIVNAKGNFWAVTVMGSGNTVTADSVTHESPSTAGTRRSSTTAARPFSGTAVASWA